MNPPPVELDVSALAEESVPEELAPDVPDPDPDPAPDPDPDEPEDPELDPLLPEPPEWSSDPVPDPVNPGTVAAVEAVGAGEPAEVDEEVPGSPAFMFSPVPRRDFRIVGESPSTTVLFVPAKLLYVYEVFEFVPGADVALKQST